MSEEQRKLAWRWSAVVVVLTAAILRLYGLTWGLPNSVHAYSYHPDEFLPVESAINILANRDINPHFYNYPTLYIYLCTVAQGVASALGFANLFGIYLACRVVTAVMGILAIVVCLYGCTRLYGRKSGILSGLFLAVIAVHAQHSHFATVDVPSTLFVVGCLLASIASFRTNNLKWLILSGILAGLAGGTKYNAGLVTLSAFVAPLLFFGETSIIQRSAKSALVMLCAVTAFIVSTPGCLLYTTEFLHGLMYELKHSSQGHGLVFAATGPGGVFALHNLSWGLGLPLLVFGIISIISASISKRKESLVLLAFLIPYLILMSTSQVRFVRYSIPVLPCFAVFSALALSSWSNISAVNKRVAGILTGLVVLSSLVYSTAVVALFSPPDPRDSSRDYISANANQTDSIGFLDLPWFYSPPLGKMIGYGTIATRRKAIVESSYPVVIFNELLSKTFPEWAVVSDYEIDDALRLREMNDLHVIDILERDKILSAYNTITSKYNLVETFERHVMWFDTSYLPHDMRYCAPRIRLYRLRQ